MPSDPYSSAERKFVKKYVRPQEGRTLIVGSFIAGGKEDRRKAFPDAWGVDMRPGPGVDEVFDLENYPHHMGKFAHIECLSVLEHSRRPWMLAQTLEWLLVPGGTLHLSVPFIWRFHSYPSDYWRFTAEGVKSLFVNIEWQVLMYASDRLRPDHYLKAMESEHPYLPRTEVLGFGTRV